LKAQVLTTEGLLEKSLDEMLPEQLNKCLWNDITYLCIPFVVPGIGWICGVHLISWLVL